jgi:hypothetical protein
MACPPGRIRGRPVYAVHIFTPMEMYLNVQMNIKEEHLTGRQERSARRRRFF